MSFIRDAAGGGKKDEEHGIPTGGQLHDAFRHGERLAKEYMEKLIDEGKAYAAKGQHVAGSIMIFVAVLRAAGIAKQGVYKADPKGPVPAVWNLIETVLTSDGLDGEGAMQALIKWQQEQGL